MPSQNNNNSVIYSEGEENLENLILEAKNGNKESFGKVYEKLYTPLYRYTLSLSKDKNTALDLCNQSFLNFYKNLNNYKSSGKPLAYLFTISKNILLNSYKKDSRILFNEESMDLQVEEKDFVKEIDTKMLSAKIEDLIDLLTENEKEIIRLFYFAELEYVEISNLLGKTEESIRKTKERALKKLRLLSSNLNERI